MTQLDQIIAQLNEITVRLERIEQHQRRNKRPVKISSQDTTKLHNVLRDGLMRSPGNTISVSDVARHLVFPKHVRTANRTVSAAIQTLFSEQPAKSGGLTVFRDMAFSDPKLDYLNSRPSKVLLKSQVSQAVADDDDVAKFVLLNDIVCRVKEIRTKANRDNAVNSNNVSKMVTLLYGARLITTETVPDPDSVSEFATKEVPISPRFYGLRLT